MAPEHILAEREIDVLAERSARSYHAFDGHEVARWYRLPASAEPGLLLGAICGTGVTGLPESDFTTAIATLGIDARLFASAFARGTRLGRRAGGRIRRSRTAYQFTRRRRAVVDHRSRRAFEELVARAQDIVAPEHVTVLQEAIFLLCEFQDAEWASVLVDHVAELVAAERAANGGEDIDPAASIVPDAIRGLAAMLVWPDAAWVANRKRRSSRLKALRSAHGISRRDAYDLVDHLPLDPVARAATRRPSRLTSTAEADAAPALLRPLRVEAIRTASVGGALRMRRLAAGARWRSGSVQQRIERDTAETWLEALHDALRTDHAIARVVARSGTLVQGAGAVRDANRATALAFWGRIVRQSIAIDRAAGGDALVARQVIPFVWEQLCRSGSLALWEYAAQVLAIALAHARGMAYADTLVLVDRLCATRRPLDAS